MIPNFLEWLGLKESDDPMADFLALRKSMGWGDRQEVGTYKPDAPGSTYGGSQQRPRVEAMTPANAENLINTFIRQAGGLGGMTNGSIQQLAQVDPQQAAALEQALNRDGYPVVDSLLHAPPGMVSFYKNRRTGRWEWTKPVRR
jgi:hypothetical protein